MTAPELISWCSLGLPLVLVFVWPRFGWSLAVPVFVCVVTNTLLLGLAAQLAYRQHVEDMDDKLEAGLVTHDEWVSAYTGDTGDNVAATCMGTCGTLTICGLCVMVRWVWRCTGYPGPDKAKENPPDYGG